VEIYAVLSSTARALISSDSSEKKIFQCKWHTILANDSLVSSIAKGRPGDLSHLESKCSCSFVRQGLSWVVDWAWLGLKLIQPYPKGCLLALMRPSVVLSAKNSDELNALDLPQYMTT